MNEHSENDIGLDDEHLTIRFVMMVLCYGTAGISFIVAITQIQHNVHIIQLAFGCLFLILGTASAVGVFRCILMDRNNVLLVQKSAISLNEDRVEWK